MTTTAIDPHATFGELGDHIAAVHHERLRRDLPQLAELLDSVMRVHGPAHLRLHDLPPAFIRLRGRLEEQVDLEERTLLPACRALDDPVRLRRSTRRYSPRSTPATGRRATRWPRCAS